MLFSLIAIYLFCQHQPDIKKSPLIVVLIAMLTELSFLGKEQFMALPFVQESLSVADIIAINKIDLVDQMALDETKKEIGENRCKGRGRLDQKKHLGGRLHHPDRRYQCH
jgi:G3E family GTPase